MNRQIPFSYKNMEGNAIGVYKPPHQLHIAVAFQPFNDPNPTYSITVPRDLIYISVFVSRSEKELTFNSAPITLQPRKRRQKEPWN